MSETLQVLIIDDSPEDREVLRRFLTHAPETPRFTVLEASSGAEGKLLFEAARPELVLLDFQLPDVSGLDLLAEILDQSEPHSVVPLMLTASGNEAVAVEAMKIGVLDYLNKSTLTATGLRRAITQALEKNRLQRELAAQQRELARKNRELENADRRKDEYLAMVAHELRNPLMSIRNAVELVKRLGQGDERFWEAVRVLERQVQHQSALLDDLLDVSRIIRGKIRLRPQRVDLCALVREAVRDMRHAFDQAGILCAAYVPDHVISVDCDPIRLGQALHNLLHNALKFTETGGRVDVFLDLQADHARVRVRDTGIGIDPEMLPRLFETFTQLDLGLARSQGGLGLGLSVVRGLVELHGGTVHACSEGLGCGAEFTILLPRCVESALPAEGGDAGFTVAHSPATRRRVLVIDDNQDAADTLRDLLELSGHAVTLAYTGEAGLDAARQVCPEVVLCDLGLPDKDGFAVAMELRADSSTAAAYLISISGYGQPEDRQRALAAGYDLHLTKPLDIEELEKALQARG